MIKHENQEIYTSKMTSTDCNKLNYVNSMIIFCMPGQTNKGGFLFMYIVLNIFKSIGSTRVSEHQQWNAQVLHVTIFVYTPQKPPLNGGGVK